MIGTVAIASAVPSIRPLLGLLAHEGGWDEALLIVGPIVAIAGVILLTKGRSAQREMSAPTARSRPTRSS